MLHKVNSASLDGIEVKAKIKKGYKKHQPVNVAKCVRPASNALRSNAGWSLTFCNGGKIIKIMNKNFKIHPIQNQILRTLLFKPKAKFAELNRLKISTDHFTFHLKSLLEAGLMEKNEEGLYTLTQSGKEFANRFDTDSKIASPEKQAKVAVLVCCLKKENGKIKFLMQKRLKQPYFGFYGSVTGKIKWQETIFEAAKRELKEETGLTGELKLAGVKHKMDYAKNGEFLEDKFFFVFKAENPKGNLIENFEGGKNIWLSRKEILALPNLFPDTIGTLEIVSQNKIIFSEKKYTAQGY